MGGQGPTKKPLKKERATLENYTRDATSAPAQQRREKINISGRHVRRSRHMSNRNNTWRDLSESGERDPRTEALSASSTWQLGKPLLRPYFGSLSFGAPYHYSLEWAQVYLFIPFALFIFSASLTGLIFISAKKKKIRNYKNSNEIVKIIK